MSQLHLKIAQQVERGYHEKTGQWGDNEFLIDLIDGYTVITFRGTETVKLKRDLVKGGVGHFLEKAKSFLSMLRLISGRCLGTTGALVGATPGF